MKRTLKVGDFVRDRAQLGGVILEVPDPNGVPMVLVEWNNGSRSYISTDFIEAEAPIIEGEFKRLKREVQT